MRTFTDAAGTLWTVFEVKRHNADARGRWTYVPAGFGNGWLCFEAGQEKRRLTQFPADWRQLDEQQLQALCGSALPASVPGSRTPGDRPDAPERAPGG